MPRYSGREIASDLNHQFLQTSVSLVFNEKIERETHDLFLYLPFPRGPCHAEVGELVYEHCEQNDETMDF